MSDTPPSGSETTTSERATAGPAASRGRAAAIGASPHALARGFAALRIFFGLIWLSNGIAKLIGVGSYDLGAVTFGLLWLPQARFIAEDAAGNTALSPLGAFYRDMVLPNWGFFGAFLTIAELAAGLALLFGVATRAAATGTLLLITPIWLLYLVSDATQYLWTYPVDLFPLLLLAIVPSGRAAGIDGRLAARFGDRWPF